MLLLLLPLQEHAAKGNINIKQNQKATESWVGSTMSQERLNRAVSNGDKTSMPPNRAEKSRAGVEQTVSKGPLGRIYDTLVWNKAIRQCNKGEYRGIMTLGFTYDCDLISSIETNLIFLCHTSSRPVLPSVEPENAQICVANFIPLNAINVIE